MLTKCSSIYSLYVQDGYTLHNMHCDYVGCQAIIALAKSYSTESPQSLSWNAT